MAFSVLRTAAALMSATVIAALPTIALAQPPEADAKTAADANAAARQRKIDDIAEAARLMTGPAANPECVWHGTRVVSLLWREDIDTALRQLELYDRFKCPAEHVQATFRCFLRLEAANPMDPKADDAVKTRARDCWINPGSSSVSPSTAATSAPTPAHPGTTNR
ncbi:MAG: beta-1-3, beta-1-6-glucan biosynthesis protein [Bradyrhizobiaceae bacterium]|nr:beta-1-3, beta-1-6-glucan biosynthesis protein [Bradyrhizobiaceae bacterium]